MFKVIQILGVKIGDGVYCRGTETGMAGPGQLSTWGNYLRRGENRGHLPLSLVPIFHQINQ